MCLLEDRLGPNLQLRDAARVPLRRRQGLLRADLGLQSALQRHLGARLGLRQARVRELRDAQRLRRLRAGVGVPLVEAPRGLLGVRSGELALQGRRVRGQRPQEVGGP
eukprot:SRR837773.4919.p4 GENE.SRR837773.4919~~SRR837773.4919.p4  ORF type:complete len:124 (-),score=21.37 SRR837773.4919:291-614(-)